MLRQAQHDYGVFMLKKITKINLLAVLLLSSTFALAFAYISQYFLNYQPCILCLYQRPPFFAVIIFSSLGLFFKNYRRAAILLCALALTINSGIAFYHVGVEQKIFAGPTTCAADDNLNEAQNLEELKNLLQKTKAIRCDEPQFFMLGLSMAAWNLIFCLILALITIFLSFRKTIYQS